MPLVGVVASNEKEDVGLIGSRNGHCFSGQDEGEEGKFPKGPWRILICPVHRDRGKSVTSGAGGVEYIPTRQETWLALTLPCTDGLRGS
ncbi:hypothetical protein RRG08_053189 [Elysia crispata]|uniref:Uncharacterized protein n=1 Tax=Elysia crispata TaxID=231223 RepID=A0AAE1D2Y9_9GAST|nr:hypothetical protein RRG08_053189 [Elysia crispata]